MNETIKIMLVEDHQLMREGIASLLQSHDDIEILAEAPDGETALEKLARHPVEIVLMDINLPGMNGIETTRKLKEKFPQVKVVALTMLDDQSHIRDMLSAGAAGYVLKNAGNMELSEAIHTVHRGQAYYSRRVADSLVQQFFQPPATPVTSGEAVYLTRREKEILALIVKELSNREIGENLEISVRTVDAHRRNLLQKIGAKNTAGLTRYALEHGIV